MKAGQVRFILIMNPDPVLLHEAVNKVLQKQKALTALESGVVAESAVANVELIAPLPPLFFDGINYVQAIYVATG